jgi:hypothetical protein
MNWSFVIVPDSKLFTENDLSFQTTMACVLWLRFVSGDTHRLQFGQLPDVTFCAFSSLDVQQLNAHVGSGLITLQASSLHHWIITKIATGSMRMCRRIVSGTCMTAKLWETLDTQTFGLLPPTILYEMFSP